MILQPSGESEHNSGLLGQLGLRAGPESSPHPCSPECHMCIPIWQGATSKTPISGNLAPCEGLWDALCSLYGEDKAKTNFPASDYANYLALAANNSMPGPAAEPLANASQLVEELQQVVISPPPCSPGWTNGAQPSCK